MTSYSLTWTQYLSELTQERIDLELFLKSHTKLQQEIDEVQDLLGDALDSVGSQTLKTDAHLKLPEIKIPEFSGNSSDWEQFWDLFTSLIDSRTDLPVSVKFSFLKSALKGTSAKLIAGFSVTQANYEEAKSLLVKQYKDDGRIARKLSGQLLDLKSPGHCHRDLSDFKIGYEQILRSLRPYHKVSDASWLVLEILIRKVSVETRTFLFQHHGQQYFSLEEFDEGLDVLISLLEGTNLKQRATESTTKPVKDTSLVKSNVAITKSTDTCMFCSEEHRSSRCPTYVSPEARRTVLFKENRCLKCCRKGHKANMCKTKVHCYNCKGSHHTLLCKGSKPKSDSSDSTSKPKDTTTQNPPSIKNSANEQPVNQLETHSVITSRVSTLASNGGGGTALPTAILRLKTRVPSNVVNTVRCFFDSGSQKSFIHPKVLKELDLKPTGSTTFHLATFGRESEPVQCATIKLRLSLGTKVFSIPFVVSDKVEMKLHIPGLSHTIKMLKKSGLRLADHKAQDQLNDISVVIGADHFSKFIRGTTRIQGVNLFSSTGGYIIYGQLPCDKSDSTVDVNTVVMSKIQVQDQMVDSCLLQDLPKPPIHNLWELDTIGIKEDSLTVGERHAVDFFTKSIQYDGDKYWVRLPWKRDPSEVPTNYRMAVGQLNSLQTHLSKNSSKFDQYNQVIREYLHNDFVEEVVDSQVKGHYLPHHGVAKESKTTPLRVVFNASAKSKSSDLSLNDALETGPSLTEKLASSLINLRIGKFAVIADISKAFLRIGLQAQDRDYVRFLWSDDPTSFPKTYRFKSVLFGSTSSPFLLQATLQRHFETCQTPMEQKLSKSFYVDNFQHSVDSEVELSEVHQLLTSCMSKAGMPLQDWNSNSPVFNSTFSEDNRKICPTVLGITWNTQSDTLSIKPVVVPQFKQLTKRKALSICSQVYDPLGLLSPVTVKSKIFLQELWKDSKGWDDPLDPETIDTFNGLVSEYRLLDQLQFPRMVSTKSDGCRLHVFCDASAKAYGAVAYLCHDNKTRLLTSRCRVAPLKTRTIPQLELTAVLVGCRLASHLLEVLPKKFEVYVWTDNLPCLQWIASDRSTIVYVKNRVAEIRNLKERCSLQLGHVDTKQNPADLLSRGCSVKNLASSQLWLAGPSWICCPDQFPKPVVTHISEILTQDIPLIRQDPIFPVDRYSTLNKLQRVTDKVIQFINLCSNNKFVHLSSATYWVRNQQIQHYPLVYEAVRLNSSENKYQESRKFISDLNLFLDEDQLLRSRGRLNEGDIAYDANCPKLLSPKSFLCQLIVGDLHFQNHHAGVQQVLSLVRKEFWIPQGRNTVKKILRRCVVCRYDKRKAFPYPGPPPLPMERVQYVHPFECTGVDFTGAIKVRNRSGETQKLYICLFTCVATRAVHLQLINSLSAEAFVLCLRRFVAKCSLPSKLLSDNGTNFVAVSKFLVELQDEAVVQDYLTTHKIKWQFISPRAPWQGGVYERMIGLTKNCLSKALHHRQVTPEELVTILAEVEAILNNRPLTYINDDDREGEILTPAHLLYGRGIILYPFFQMEERNTAPCNLNTLVLYHNHISCIIEKFHSLFVDNYLTMLREKHYLSRKPPSRCPKLGEVVILSIDMPKVLWHLGRVVKLIPSADSIVREVEVITKNTIVRRTVDKLIPLELCSSEDDNIPLANNPNLEISPPADQIEAEPQLSVRPKRKTAEAAENFVRDLIRKDLL